jgi:uncharacterized protein (TIGR02588 family)
MEQHAKASMWEWVAAAIGAALVIAVIGFLTYRAIVARADPYPRLSVSVDSIIGYGDGYIVEFRAENAGGAPVADLLVQGRISSDTGVVEESEVTIDFVPPESSQRGGLLFTKDPRAYRLEVRPAGYDRP